MNNEQFRRLLLDTGDKTQPAQNGTSSSQPPASGQSLGSRKSAFATMTPRHLIRGGNSNSSSGINFVRPGTERNTAQKKNFKSSGPKGVKLAKGYQDRALDRLNTEADKEEAKEDDKAAKLKALAQQAMEGKLSMEEFEKIRAEIAGGDVASTHLVKGLDRKLLERVRKGEDVMAASTDLGQVALVKDDVDDELDEFETKEVQKVEKQEKNKKGEAANMKIPSTVAGVKRSRDDILKELKAKREAEAQARIAARPELGDKFKAIESRDKPKITIDKKGREVIITRDENGRVKKKVRKVTSTSEPALPEPEQPLTIVQELAAPIDTRVEVPEEPEESSEPEAMFEEAGSDYNPLAGLDDEDDDSSSDEDAPNNDKAQAPSNLKEVPLSSSSDGEPDQKDPDTTTKAISGPPARRNYFAKSMTDAVLDEDEPDLNPFSDPSFVSAISRASKLAEAKSQADADDEDGDEDENARRERLDKEARLKKKREAMMASSARDMDDLDLGFGGDRFDDDDDGDERIKLSEWKADGDGDESDGAGKGKGAGAKKKRTRPGKKRKGNKNDARDVLEVMRQRQADG